MLKKKYNENSFQRRHIGIKNEEEIQLLRLLEYCSLEALKKDVVPHNILSQAKIDLQEGLSEQKALDSLKHILKKNKNFKSWIGQGYYNCIMPAVIKKNLFENPGWYTAYTPYQAEISQGRLEALFNFQTVVCDLTDLQVANASLLDEATAAVEAMLLANKLRNKGNKKSFFVDKSCHPQTISVIETRAKALKINLLIEDCSCFDFSTPIFGALFQYPNTFGAAFDFSLFIEKVQKQQGLAILACDLLSLVILKSPGSMNADIAIGSSQRFGCPLGFGGPHAAFFASKKDFVRQVPGRIIGLTKDKYSKRAFRMALQTREQHIRREKATSNICTAQALLANIAGMYAVYHGQRGLLEISNRVHFYTSCLHKALVHKGYSFYTASFFDTLCIITTKKQKADILQRAISSQVNLRFADEDKVLISLDETTEVNDLLQIIDIFSASSSQLLAFLKEDSETHSFSNDLERQTTFLEAEVFKNYHSETEMMRYLKKLENKDYSLTTGMIPLGSCTMKLNAATQMQALQWEELLDIHPFAPQEQTLGCLEMITQLEKMLCLITGFAGVSLQPNSGAQGELAGLLAVKEYFKDKGEFSRDICLIPQSAHGTNPASAALAGFCVVTVRCLDSGAIDLNDLRDKAEKYASGLAVFMVTYPSTFGVFDEEISEVCELIHSNGGQVYLDGANFNAQMGLMFPGSLGFDVCHLNLHKTFCIPHGGGGPGSGPIAVKKHLIKYLPSTLHKQEVLGPVSAAPYGSPMIYPIPWLFIKMMGASGLYQASQIAILNANYIVKRLSPYYDIPFKNKKKLVAHECIIDFRNLKKRSGVSVSDVAKRLMDYGFHAPTVSWPVVETMMIEPTESESKKEIDRFCDALIYIRQEIQDIIDGKVPKDDNPLKNAPHVIAKLAEDSWKHSYSKKEAFFPGDQELTNKYWPCVSRVDEAFGDRNFVCSWSQI